MITPDLDEEKCTGSILIEPNRPISWQDNVRFIKVFALVSFLIGVFFVYHGFILVLPYSGLEVLLLALCLYLVYKHYTFCQVIYFTENSVIIESGDDHVLNRIEYQRHWSKFHVEKSGRYNIPRFSIQSMGKSTEIGSFLNHDDKVTLIKLVKDITNCYQSNQTRTIQKKHQAPTSD